MNSKFQGGSPWAMRPNGTFKLSSLDDPTGTIFVADIDGYNSCLYPDENDNGGKINSGNVLYRHSGGTEKSSFYMGASSRAQFGTANSNYFDGTIANVRFWQMALTADEVELLYINRATIYGI